MKLFAALTAGFCIPLFAWAAWRWSEDRHAERLADVRRACEDRVTAYRRWAGWYQEREWRRRWAL